jgi:hypothetical protein
MRRAKGSHVPTSRLTTLVTGTLLTGVVSAGLTVTTPEPADAADRARVVGQGEDRRRIVTYVVRPGDTATGLAVRFHAWTSELLAKNGLRYGSMLRVGQRIRIPVVPPALREERPASRPPQTHHHRPAKPEARPWRWADPSREKVRRVIARTADRYGVDRQLALAVSWQEAGWQMHHVSHAGAIGAMQVIPATGAWMSLYVGHRLRLHRLHDNAAAGVMLLRVLRDNTDRRRARIGAYYQGLGAVNRHGLYDETKRYVDNVVAIWRRLEAGRAP